MADAAEDPERLDASLDRVWSLAVDVRDPLRPREIGCYVPELPDNQEAIQSNDIGADEHGRLYLIDRAGAGMHILEYTG